MGQFDLQVISSFNLFFFILDDGHNILKAQSGVVIEKVIRKKCRSASMLSKPIRKKDESDNFSCASHL